MDGAAERSANLSHSKGLEVGAGKICSLSQKDDFGSPPHRIQRQRTKGWRMPDGAVYVGRGSKWGNPFTFANSGAVHPAIRFACEVAPLLDVTPLRGKNLACWCAIGAECHADVLLELANAA